MDKAISIAVFVGMIGVLCIVLVGIALNMWRFRQMDAVQNQDSKNLSGCALERYKCLRNYCPHGPVSQCPIPPGGGCPNCDTNNPANYYVDFTYNTKEKSISIDLGGDNGGYYLYDIQVQKKNLLLFRYSFYGGHGTTPPPPPSHNSPLYSFDINKKIFKL